MGKCAETFKNVTSYAFNMGVSKTRKQQLAEMRLRTVFSKTLLKKMKLVRGKEAQLPKGEFDHDFEVVMNKQKDSRKKKSYQRREGEGSNKQKNHSNLDKNSQGASGQLGKSN